jgi:hypothetical protein
MPATDADRGTGPARDRTPPLPQLVVELKDLVIAYVREQTLVPLKALLRYVGFGIAGAFLLGIGVLLLGVGMLRALQTETGDTFTGDWSWAPYVIVVAALVLGASITWMARGARKTAKEAR